MKLLIAGIAMIAVAVGLVRHAVRQHQEMTNEYIVDKSNVIASRWGGPELWDNKPLAVFEYAAASLFGLAGFVLTIVGVCI